MATHTHVRHGKLASRGSSQMPATAAIPAPMKETDGPIRVVRRLPYHPTVSAKLIERSVRRVVAARKAKEPAK